jgi:hypothetical protein
MPPKGRRAGPPFLFIKKKSSLPKGTASQRVGRGVLIFNCSLQKAAASQPAFVPFGREAENKNKRRVSFGEGYIFYN